MKNYQVSLLVVILFNLLIYLIPTDIIPTTPSPTKHKTSTQLCIEKLGWFAGAGGEFSCEYKTKPLKTVKKYFKEYHKEGQALANSVKRNTIFDSQSFTGFGVEHNIDNSISLRIYANKKLGNTSSHTVDFILGDNVFCVESKGQNTGYPTTTYYYDRNCFDL